MQESERLTLYWCLNRFYSYPSGKYWPAPSVLHCSTLFKEAIESLGLTIGGEFLALFNHVDLHELQIEYTRLFVSSLRGVPAKPYASYYLDHKKEVMGESTLWVREFYHSFALSAEGENHEPPDHIATELGFIASLIAEELNALWNKNQEQKEFIQREEERFLKEHWLKWAGIFFACVSQNAQNLFYQTIGRISAELHKFESQRLKERV
ncbi:MAG: molecular chaperone [bacterium]